MVRPISFEDAYPFPICFTNKETWGSVADRNPNLTYTSKWKNNDQFKIFSGIWKSLKNNYMHEYLHIYINIPYYKQVFSKFFKLSHFIKRIFYNNLNYIAAKHCWGAPRITTFRRLGQGYHLNRLLDRFVKCSVRSYLKK